MTATREKLQAYVDRLVALQQQRVQNALRQIPNRHRHLLAVRGYIRFASRIDARWAMTDAEEAEYRRTPEYRAMVDELERIEERFAATHSGYALATDPRARSLETQIRMWNNNDTVLALGRRLEILAREELDDDAYPDAPGDESVEAFRQWIGQRPGAIRLRAEVQRERNGRQVTVAVNSPTNATPGLSSHGRIRAIDFVVRRGNRTIARADSAQIATVWRGPDNWQQRLNDAINAVSGNWDGPLQNPDEPWHYTYEPEPAT